MILAKERKTSLVPISKSPFEKSDFEDLDEPEHGELGEIVRRRFDWTCAFRLKGLLQHDIQEDELQVYVTEVPWSDLVSLIVLVLRR